MVVEEETEPDCPRTATGGFLVDRPRPQDSVAILFGCCSPFVAAVVGGAKAQLLDMAVEDDAALRRIVSVSHEEAITTR